MCELSDLIKKHRPHLSESSVKTYTNCLKNLFSSIWDKTEFNYKLFFAQYKKVLEYLEKVKFNVRKTILSALVVISKDEKQEVIDAYRKQMLEDANKYNAIEKTNTMSESMSENWISWEDILAILNKLKKKVYWIFDESKPSKEQLLELQKFVILMCYTQIPPRRIQDYIEMKYQNYDDKKDNYYHKGYLHFNVYKTAKFYGKQSEKIPPILTKILNKWVTLRKDTDYLFTDYYNKQMTASGMTKTINSIFEKNVSVNILRHAYITSICKPEIEKLEKIAENMGHSTKEQKLYVKINHSYA